MSARQLVHDFVRDLYRSGELRAAFAADPAGVIARYPFSVEERGALLDGSFPALAGLGMHPLMQMIYSLAKHPEIKTQISVRDYLADLDPGA